MQGAWRAGDTRRMGAAAVWSVCAESAFFYRALRRLIRTPGALCDFLQGLPWVTEVVAGFSELVMYCTEPIQLERQRPQIVAALAQSVSGLAAAHAPRRHRIVVDYNGAGLATASELLSLSQDELVAAHSSSRVTVAVMGFRPFFGYCLGLDARLTLPRKAAPTMVEAGAVAIAGGMTAIYPDAGPGGWHVIGHCDPIHCRSLKVGDVIAWDRL